MRLNLWQRFRELCRRHGGVHSSGVDIALTDTDTVVPDLYYFRTERRECMIANDFFQLSRRGHRVHLDVSVDARRYRALLAVWARREAWDWGEEAWKGDA